MGELRASGLLQRDPGGMRRPPRATRRSRITALLVASAVIAAATYGVRTLTGGAPEPPAQVGPTDIAAGVSDGEELTRLIAFYEARSRSRPTAPDLTRLAGFYLQRASITDDAALYARAAVALDEAQRLAPAFDQAAVTRATLNFTTHRFSEALSDARAILDEDPSSVEARAIAGDSLVELGRYAEAGLIYDALDRDLPGSAGVAARRARLAFVLGDPDEALRLSSSATSIASRSGLPPTTLSWYHVLEAALRLALGRYGEADALLEQAVTLAPEYHVALSVSARAKTALGELDEAAARYDRALAVTQDPEYLAASGDIAAAGGNDTLANERYGSVMLVSVKQKELRHLLNRPLAMFYADHGQRPDEAVRLARADVAIRPDVYSADVYAWALHAAGRYREARAWSDRALARGTPEAVFWYHAGMISAALGEDDRARTELTKALEMSPHFDPLQAPRARAALAALPPGA